MSRLLLDTSVILYLLKYPDRLGASALQSIKESDEFYVSMVSLWEIAIKTKAGKLQVILPVAAIPGLIGAQEIDIRSTHTDAYLDITLPHKDPFDTMLVAQSVSEGMLLITADKLLLDSPYKTVDARI